MRVRKNDTTCCLAESLYSLYTTARTRFRKRKLLSMEKATKYTHVHRASANDGIIWSGKSALVASTRDV